MIIGTVVLFLRLVIFFCFGWEALETPLWFVAAKWAGAASAESYGCIV